MSPKELAQWLSQNADRIDAFMDYEIVIESEEELAATLEFWFEHSRWVATNHRFIPLGVDGTGSQFAAWIRPGNTQIPVVFFGSEGGAGVVAASCDLWAQTIAFAPAIDEYPEPGDARLSVEMNWKFDNDLVGDELADHAYAMQSAYRVEVEERFGKLTSLEELMSGLEDIEAEFEQWLVSAAK